MRVLVVGVGMQGFHIVRDLVSSDEVSEVVAADINIEKLNRDVARLRGEKVKAKQIDARDNLKLVELMKEGFDVVCNALLPQFNVDVARAAIEAGVNLVDVTMGNPETLSSPIYQLDESAKAAGVTILPGCGLDPGLEGILAAYGAHRLDRVEKIHIWCGGFPQKGTAGYNNPLKYKITWSFEWTIRSYIGKAEILRDGEVVCVDKFSNPEIIKFDELDGECEAFYSGAPFVLVDRFHLRSVKDAWIKTVRWKGHCEVWRKLIDLDLVSEKPIRINGIEVTPMEFFVKNVSPILQYEKGEGDVVVLRVEVIGEKRNKKRKYIYDLIDFYDEENDAMAMNRTTAFTCSIVAQMIARGDVKEKGVLHRGIIGWNTQLAKLFFSELASRHIYIKEIDTHLIS